MANDTYDAAAIVGKFQADPIRMTLLFAIAMGFGFVQYLYSLKVHRGSGRSPFPAYMHAYYLAHDLLYVCLFDQWFRIYRCFVFEAVWAGMVAFNVLEIMALRAIVRDERQETFGRFHRDAVTGRQAVVWTSAFASVAFVMLLAARTMLDDRLMFCLFISTNVMMAIGPALTARERMSRVPGSLGLAIAIALGTAATFMPPGLGLYTTADAAYFSRPPFYALGATCLLIALWHVATIASLPLDNPIRPRRAEDAPRQ